MSYKIIGKYIKDLDFKIPNPKIFSILSKNISNYKINIDIRSSQIRERIIQVETTLNLAPIKDDIEKISTKITYATIIELNDGITDKKEIEKIILINVPSKIYPELRKIFVFIFESSGFKDIKISNSVDFQKLYNLKKVQ
jgi:preprotein translocase subunit SecB